MNGITKIVDDVLIASENFPQHMEDVKALLDRCREKNITLNKKKMKLAQPKVKFAGYMVGINGIEVDPDKIEAVWKFPTPATRQDLKSFMGLINQFCQIVVHSETAAIYKSSVYVATRASKSI